MNPKFWPSKITPVPNIPFVVVIMLLFAGYVLLNPLPLDAKGTVRLGVSRSPLSAPLIVAFDQGYFHEEDVDVTLVEYNSGKRALDGLLSGKADISTVAGTPIMFSSFKRQDYCVLGTFVYSYHDTKMIARRDKGIDKPSDLKKKRIGVNMGTTGQFFLSTFLVYNGLLASEVEIVGMGTKKLPEALKNGAVDAIAVWEPHANRAEKLLGDRAIRLPSSEIYRTTFSLVAMKKFVTSETEAIKKVLKAIDKAILFINREKHRSQAIVAKRLGKKKQAIGLLWDEYEYELFLDQALILTLADEARWAIKNKLTKKPEVPNFMEFICFDALKAVKPEAVTIIH
ncbi:MAG: ABC transporter substrate-binding protein [Deltaproteobacteria bacterium]|nr:ABC transporter substrate-binding protein [Deltaproteobacteria bacterium]